MTQTHHYDHLAPTYDTRYRTVYHAAENRTVARWLTPHVSTLDIGCGTGLLPELVEVYDTSYLGIDPSQGMLDQFGEKFPDHETLRMTAEAYLAGPAGRWGQVAALFGAASYLEPDTIRAIPSLLLPGGAAVLMFYGEGYLPDFERDEQEMWDRAKASLAAGLEIGDHWKWHTFVVVTVGW